MCLRTTIKHFLKLFLEISCGFENKVVTLRHGFLIQLIMKQVEERYISLLTDKVFDRLFEEAKIAKFTPQEMREYEASKKAYRDIKNSIDTAKQEGLAEGLEIGMEKGMKQGMEKGMNLRSLEIARKMLAKGMDDASVMDMTRLTAEEIKLLKAEM